MNKYDEAFAKLPKSVRDQVIKSLDVPAPPKKSVKRDAKKTTAKKK